MDRQHAIAAGHLPEVDLSGDFGRRTLRLLAVQVDRNLEDLGERGPGVRMKTLAPPEPRYLHYFLGSNAFALAVLALAEADVWPGVASEELLATSVDCLEALVATHPLAGGAEPWSAFSAGRFMFHLATTAILLGDSLPAESRGFAGRILAAEADRFLGRPAPAQLRDDTQAESNAWHGGGLAAAACALPDHPRRDEWEQKALGYMISAYATEADVVSDRIVDGRPLRAWLTGPNALDDHTVENHGFVHPDYMGAVSEMARAAIPYALVGRPRPEAVTFNAGQVFDRLAGLTLSDASHLYVQGTDYTARRIDGSFQAALIAILRPTPLRTALLLRWLERMERMTEQWPALPMHAWPGLPHDLGCTWGLTQNYLAARVFGIGDEVLPDGQIEEQLSGTHVSAQGQFLVHRTARSITSFAWHSDERRAHVLGLSMPLGRDTLCYPMPGSWFGEVSIEGDAEEALGPCRLRRQEGATVVATLFRCGGALSQHCAFILLDAGGAIFLSEMQAGCDVTMSRATAGTVWLFDDLRWPEQAAPRSLVGASGALTADGAPHTSNWVCVDDRLGWAALGAQRCVTTAVPGEPAIFRKRAPMYDTLRCEFLLIDGSEVLLSAGERCCRFAMVIRPGISATQTAALAEGTAWLPTPPGVLGLRMRGRLCYANLTDEAAQIARTPVGPWSCGLLPR